MKDYSQMNIVELEKERQRGSTTTIILDQPSTSYYISVPALNIDIRECINSLTKDKVIITITTIEQIQQG